MESTTTSGKTILDALNSGATMSSIVDPLVSIVQNGGEISQTVASVLNFCFYASGADVDADDAAFTSEADIQAVLEEVVARVHDRDCVSILLSKDAKYKRLRKNFVPFFHSLTLAAESMKVPEVTDSLITWLIHMNESKVRSFRHVALMASCGIADGLHERSLFLASQGSQGGSRASKVNASSKAKIDGQLGTIFQHTVHNRIKDVSPEIRVAAIQKLKQWFTAYPDRYCVNSYLIYLRFALFDKKPEMRLEALESIGCIVCEVPQGLSRITALLSKCVDRLVEMCKDVDTKCAHASIKLCTVLVKNAFHFDHALLDDVFEGLLDDRSIIRSAVGTFLKHFMAVTSANSGATPFAFIVALLQTLKYQCPSLVEEYLIDALWSNEDPPLADVHDEFSTLLKSETEEDVLKGLRCVSSLLRRASGGDARLGPSPKDDLYLVTKGKKAFDAREKMLTTFSHMIIEEVESVLKRFSESREILLAVSSVFETIAFDSCPASVLKKAVRAFRIACRDATIEMSDVSCLSSAWRRIAFTQYVESSAGEAELKEYARDVSKAVEGRSKGSDSDWIRMALVSSVTHVLSAWDAFLSALLSAMDKNNFSRVEIIASVCFNSVMWAVASDARDGTSTAAEKIETFAPALISFIGKHTGTLDNSVQIVLSTLLVFSADLFAIPSISVPENVVTIAVESATNCLEFFSARVKSLGLNTRELCKKIAIANDDNTQVWADYIPTRAELSALEKTCAKVISSISRLFLLQKIPPMAAVALFPMWIVVPKTSADVLKVLFHALRERLGGSGFTLEKAILSASIERSDASNISSLATVGLVGSKLASIHFAGTDKFYNCCTEMVEHALTNCLNEPLWLHATVMYCSKLRQVDALTAYRHAQQVQGNLGDNAYYATYLYTIAKAAKVTDGVKPPVRNPKRGREEEAAIDEDPDLSEVIGQTPNSLSASQTKKNPKSDGRTTNAAGWRVNGSTAQLDERTLVATQEWE